jgi:hypothetical protein
LNAADASQIARAFKSHDAAITAERGVKVDNVFGSICYAAQIAGADGFEEAERINSSRG